MTVDYTGLEERLHYVRGELKDFQIACVEHLLGNKRCIIDSWMGTGKTLVALTATLAQRPESILVVCSKNALYTWQKEIKKWYPAFADSYTIVSANPKKRPALWERDTLFHVVTYATLRMDQKIATERRFDVCIADEVHKGGLRNRQSQGFKVIKAVTKDIPCVYMLSGTVISKGPQELWGMLHILNRKLFTSYWRFVESFCVVVDGFFGREILGVQNTEGLEQLTRPYLFRVPKSVSDKELPPITRKFIKIRMGEQQAKYYNDMCEDLIVEFEDDDIVIAGSPLTRITRLRQLLCCPAILGSTDIMGAGIEKIVSMIEEQGESHVVIFVPYRDAVTKYKAYLEDLGYHVNRLWGSLEPKEVQEQIEEFKAKEGLMLCTINFSQSFELETAANCYFVGYDYDQNNNFQAEGRLRRMISENPITAYYIEHIGTIDEDMLEILNHKTRMVRNTFQTIDQVKGLIGRKNSS